MKHVVRVIDLGRLAYLPALELQRRLVRARIDGEVTDDLLLLVEHDPVVTLGRGTKQSSLPMPEAVLRARGYEVVEVERGGDVTVHAPGQLVVYPILDLQQLRADLHWYLRQLEETIIRGLDTLGIASGRNPGRTGVWVGNRKIASIGVHVKRWVTLHGVALNVTTDLSVFNVVVPCGIDGVVMTSVARETEGRGDGPANSSLWASSRDAVLAGFAAAFDRQLVAASLPELADVA